MTDKMLKALAARIRQSVSSKYMDYSVFVTHLKRERTVIEMLSNLTIREVANRMILPSPLDGREGCQASGRPRPYRPWWRGSGWCSRWSATDRPAQTGPPPALSTTKQGLTFRNNYNYNNNSIINTYYNWKRFIFLN